MAPDPTDPHDVCPGCGASDPMGDEDAWHRQGCPLIRAVVTEPRNEPTTIHGLILPDGREAYAVFEGLGHYTVLSKDGDDPWDYDVSEAELERYRS